MFTVTFRSCMKNISTCMAAKSLRNESRVAVSGTHSIVFPKTRQGMNLCCCSYYYACDAEARGYLIQLNGFLYLHLHGDRKVICNRYGFHTFFNKIDIETFMKKLDIMEFNPLTITCNIFFNS